MKASKVIVALYNDYLNQVGKMQPEAAAILTAAHVHAELFTSSALVTTKTERDEKGELRQVVTDPLAHIRGEFKAQPETQPDKQQEKKDEQVR